MRALRRRPSLKRTNPDTLKRELQLPKTRLSVGVPALAGRDWDYTYDTAGSRTMASNAGRVSTYSSIYSRTSFAMGVTREAISF
ncbi:MAG: hypothetical protein SFY80_01885 [Verrucomicrobiota bacterium]|nr:hypothetical protein [Verrucomicrobiota bacterium]